ncbi:MAG: hypothetical protein N3E47_00725 [Candidatus Bathyarchaeota archaeon]|nr:hypothetical protein [Candidatus Bathyarchaeota archaeon]
MGSEEVNLELTIKYKDVEARFSGKPDEVIRAFFGFMCRVLPTYDLASQLTLTVDLENLLASVKNIIAFTPEGPVVAVPREKLGGDRNMIMLNLIRAYIGYKTGRLERDSLSTSEIMAFTGGKSGTVAARLSELTDMGLVERVGRGEYRVTTLGVKYFLDEVLPKIKLEEKDRVE